MIKLEETKVTGWEAAIRGMRNPMNSWEQSDSVFFDGDEYHDICGNSGPCSEKEEGFDLGCLDHDLMIRLAKAGSVDAKYRRMLIVTVDITAPLYWWKEFDTYKVGTVANSCSTMHKIQAKEFTLEDFSCEHLFSSYGDPSMNLNYGQKHPLDVLRDVIAVLNHFRKEFNRTKDKRYWWQMIQLLPTSYNQRRTVLLNYEVLAGIYPKRKNHKLDEWHVFCDWIKSLPYSELIIGEEKEEEQVTCEMIFKDFCERFPQYKKHVVDYRPGKDPRTITIWLDEINVETLESTITYDYKLKKVTV